ncbi:MAG: hypothetical protein K8S22_05060 [Betaproteobacteria bacterium]|nr:hypothetical protein [Betaproteobacteria bacterium]
MARSLQGSILKVLLWALVALAIAVGAVLGVNAIDDDLSAEATALMVMPQPPAPSERNGYVDSLGLGAAEGESPYTVGLKVLAALKAQDQPGFKASPVWQATIDLHNVQIDKEVVACKPAEMSCLELTAGKPESARLVAKYDGLLARYRAMRAKPEFVELYYPARFQSTVLAGMSPRRLMLYSITVKASAGDLEGAVRELELENAFHRKMAAANTTLLQKMISVSFLQQDALFISDLVRTKFESMAPFLPRLEALMRPLSAEEANMANVLRLDATVTAFILYNQANAPFFLPVERPWWHSMAPLLYRPAETVNLYAAQNALLRTIAGVPAPQYFKAADEAARKARALAPQGPANYLVNPVGRGSMAYDNKDESFNSIGYMARIHDTQGLYALVAVQLRLRAAGTATPAAIAAALAGPLGAARPDPYTEKPMSYDPKTNSLGFESQNDSGVIIQELKKRHSGKVAVAL